MNKLTNNCLGLKVTVLVPSSVEEFDALAKESGAALKSAVLNVVYRSWNNIFRDKFSDFLAEKTGIKRETEVVLAKDGTPKKDDDGAEVLRYTETAADHVDRVMAQLVKDNKAATVEAALASYSADAQTIADSIVFDPSEKESKSTGPKKVAKKWIDVATKLANDGKLEIAATKLTNKLGYAVEATIESVAAGISEDQRRVAAAAAQAAADALVD